MNKKVYKRFKLAENQLETAIMLFLTGDEKFSVITLAGAADVILCELIIREKKENFTDFHVNKEKGVRTRQEVGKDINNALGINVCKHLDPGNNEYITLDVDDCALGAILKAIVNYKILRGDKNKLVQEFLCWIRENIDSRKFNSNS